MVEVRRDVWGQQTGGPDAFTECGAGGTWGSASVVSCDHCKVSAAAHVAGEEMASQWVGGCSGLRAGEQWGCDVAGAPGSRMLSNTDPGQV